MLTALPLITFLVSLFTFHNLQPKEHIRRLFLWCAVSWGVCAIFSVELLSLVDGVTTTNLATIWLIPLLLLVLFLFRLVCKGHRLSMPRFEKPQSWAEIGLWFGISVVLFLTALVAWKSPPQTWDSLNYHMSRVAHWSQQSAVRHYPTGIEVQNNMAPGAEILVLQTYVLSASDDWVNFIQWFAMLGSTIGVTWLAAQLGVGRLGQALAAVFAVSIPIGIAEATSTMTDYVVAFWLVCVAAEGLCVIRDEVSDIGLVMLASSAGLAILTKPTAFAFLLPFAILVGWHLIRNLPYRRVVRFAVMGFLIVLLLNLGHFSRNTEIYGNPIGPDDRFDQHANQLLSLRGLVSNFVRNTAMHLQTPSPHVNKAIALGVQWLHEGLDLDVNDVRTTAAGRFKVTVPRMNENSAGNPLHASVILVVFGMILWRRKSLNTRLIVFAGALFASALVFSFLFKWLIFGTRLQLPFFVLSAPLVGGIFGYDSKKRLAPIIGFFLLIASLPWLLSIDSRPIIPSEGRTLVDSIFEESRMNLLFANGNYLLEPARDMIIKISEAECLEIGLMLAGNSLEYPFWTLLGAPQDDLHLEWIVEGTYSSVLASEDFEPCAIICENCSFADQTFRGLTLVHERAPYSLYLRK